MAVAGYNIYLGGVKQNTSLVTNLSYALSGLTASTAYSVTVSAVDDSGNESAQSAATNFSTIAAAGDTTAPTYITGFPTTANVLETSFDAQVQLNEIGKAYMVVVADLATAPTSAQVKAGLDSTGAAALKAGNVIVAAASTTYTIPTTGLTASTAYDVYVVAEDDETTPNLQATPVKLDITTSAAAGYSTESTAVFARMATEPPTEYKDAINTAVNSLVSAGIWSKIDELQYAGLDTSANSLRGWKGVVNATTNGVHAPKTGLTYNGTDQFSGTGFIPATHGVNYTLNNAFMGCYVRSGTYPASERHLMGVRDAVTGTRAWLNLDPAGTLTHRINGAAAIAHTPATTGFGANNLWINRRTDASTIALHKNGAIVSSGAAAAGGLSAREIYEAALNYEGFGASYELACTTVLRVFGGGMSDAEITTLSNTLATLVADIDAIV